MYFCVHEDYENYATQQFARRMYLSGFIGASYSWPDFSGTKTTSSKACC